MEIEKIMNICSEKNECINCPLYIEELGDCSFSDVPERWYLEDIERRLENYGKEKN